MDSHAYGGYTVSPYYDSMIRQVITYGRTRKIALDRMYRALSEYLIRGIDKPDFLKAVLLDPPSGKGKPRPHTLRSFWRVLRIFSTNQARIKEEQKEKKSKSKQKNQSLQFPKNPALGTIG